MVLHDKWASNLTAEFFQYTRDGDWMQEAVGENANWLNIEGMSAWHAQGALHSLQRKYVELCVFETISRTDTF